MDVMGLAFGNELNGKSDEGDVETGGNTSSDILTGVLSD